MPRPKSRRSFSKEFKLQVIRDVDAGVSIAEAARMHNVHPETVRLWRKNERKYGERAFAGTAARTPMRRRSPNSSVRSGR